MADCVVVEKIRYVFRCEEGEARRGNPFETVVTLRGCVASLAMTLVFFLLRALRFAKYRPVYQITQAMQHHQVYLLDPRCALCRHSDFDIRI